MHTYIFEVDFGYGIETLRLQASDSSVARKMAKAQWGGTARSITFCGID